MDISMISIGERIKNRRIELELTQTDIYQACGISSGALSKIENGNRTPSVLSFYELCKVLKCSMDWLTTGFSSNEQIPSICQKEEELLKGFRQLEEEDQYELMEILAMKLRKVKKDGVKMEKLSNLTGDDDDSMVG